MHAKHRVRDIMIGKLVVEAISTAREATFTVMTINGHELKIILTIKVHESRSKPVDPVTLNGPSVLPLDSMIKETESALDNADRTVKAINIHDEWRGVVENVQWVMQTVKDVAEIHPYTELAWGILSAFPEMILSQFERDQNVVMLVKAMRDTFDLTQAKDILVAIKPGSNQALILKTMLKHVSICNDVIQRYASDKQFVKRLFKNITGEASDEIQTLCDTLTNLRRDFVDNGIINMQIAVHLIQQSLSILSNDTTTLDFNAKINDLPYRSGWSMAGNRSGCLEGTRADFLEYILDWISNQQSVRCLVLFGKLGTGKSSIAFEIASRFCFDEHPGSYFSFVRAQRSKQTDHYLFTTIIRDMADRYPLFKLELGKIIANNTLLRTSDDFDQLFEILLLRPLLAVKAMKTPDLIVIDGLDESGDPETMAHFLSRSLKRLPLNFRVLITSRSEGNIESYFRAILDPPFKIIQMDDPNLASKVEDDIRLYFQTHLKPHLYEKHGDDLVNKANGLFQWASVACGHLKKRPAGYTEKDCLRGLLGGREDDKKFGEGLASNLYSLYTEVLSAHFTPDKWTIVRPRFCLVMGQLLAAFESLSVDTLTELRRFNVHDDDYDDESVPAVVECMGSLMSNVTSGNHHLPVVPLHTSFRDFLITHEELANACLGLMIHELTFNICRLESSHLLNTDVDDLHSRINRFISPALLYACRFWGDHLTRSAFSIELLEKLETFFFNKFLFWLEILSVTQNVQIAVEAITVATKWLQIGLIISDSREMTDRIRELIDMVSDGLTFVRYFGKIIAMSTPHIYVSALPFAPSSSRIYSTYSIKFPSSVTLIKGRLSHWPTMELSISVDTLIVCVEFSPDGKWIACGLLDGPICLWNSTTGAIKNTRFVGHTGQVYSVAFSPNAQHILSGSSDRTIRLWNVATGTPVGGPWTGHTGSVTCVAFSPDGRYVVSASYDCTIRVWDAATGSTIGNPVTAHTKGIRAIAFSPNGKRIVSGSGDLNVCLWTFNSAQGTILGPTVSWSVPSIVSSVAFSPNSEQIAVGCFDRNAYIWDDLSELANPVALTGHAFSVNSVKFSPDGQHLVSGSTDGKLFLWNTSTKALDGVPLIGPPGSVRSVAFSSDGQRIASIADQIILVWNANSAKHAPQTGSVPSYKLTGPVRSVAMSPSQNSPLAASGSEDGTVCLWNTETDCIVAGPLHGHTGQINWFSFSPDGERLVSASNDCTLCIWNVVDSGRMQGSPCVGHTDSVCCVCFFPDGKTIVSGSQDGDVFLWDTETGTVTERLPIDHPDAVVSMNFSQDGRQFVIGHQRGVIQVWDVLETKASMKRRFVARGDKVVINVGFISDGELIIACFIDGTATIWNSNTGDILEDSLNITDDQGTQVTSVSLSLHSPSRIAVALRDHTIIVWDWATYPLVKSLPPFKGHVGFVNSLAFSQNGDQIVSGSDDCTIRVWKVEAETVGHEELPSVDISKVDGDGWIRGVHGELIICIPQTYLPALQRPESTVAIFANNPIRLDFSKFLHGQEWYSSYSTNT
uniref:Nephrocystin 3-like N-terminal domain-containing protein n=1 Tax=Psilocybe cubensis TaxID=181762 RepID=A0A8H8CGW4_PSICU